MRERDDDFTIFSSIDQIQLPFITSQGDQDLVCMINYGEYEANDIPYCSNTILDGLRVAFHKNDMIPALDLCRDLKEKGYKVFVQAMVSLNYDDHEFLNLLNLVDEIEPYSFYIVDSFGAMKKKDLMRLFFLVDNNLNKSISIGFHSHNNMQLAYSNAQLFVDMSTEREIIIDTCIMGMGRGAGNLNTELFVEYLNENNGKSYFLKPLLNIIDEILVHFYRKNYWGYSLPNYLSAKHNLHPNYASYLDSKKTLTVEAMNDIFSLMDPMKYGTFDKEYIEAIYMKYMQNGSVQSTHYAELKEKIYGKEVLIIAPGLSSVEQKDRIISCIRTNNVISIGINHNYRFENTDYLFVSNLKRFKDLEKSLHKKCIVTSNISAENVFFKAKYSDLLNDISGVRDNAGMMLIKFLINLGARKLYIAGMDGYSFDPEKNYSSEYLNFYSERSVLEQMNAGIELMISRFRNEIEMEFITESNNMDL